MAKLILLCGKIASGKTHWARTLCQRENAILLSCDELTLTLRAEGDFDAIAARSREYLYRLSERVLRANINVLLDFGFWSREERRQVARRFRDFDVQWYYVVADEDSMRRNLLDRQRDVDEGRLPVYPVDEGLIRKMESLFDPPEPDEPFIVIHNHRGAVSQ